MASRRNNQMRPGYGLGNRKLPTPLGGGGRLGGFSDHQVSPWLSGPGGDVSRLPISPSMNSGYADPQAQLALASNLLNNLLGGPGSATPPSLLSLGNAAGQGLSGFGSLPQGLMRDRFNLAARVNQAQRDYGRRDNFSNNKGGKRFGGDQGRNKNQGRNKSSDQNKKQKDADSKDDSAKTGDSKLDEDEANRSDEKRDDESGNAADGDTESETDKSYTGIIPCLFYCHICRKHMWDEASFVKHLDGRPHKMMINELDQTYKMTVELLRHETRVMEQQRESDIQRAHRKGKTGLKMQQRGFCTMCDLNFLGTLPAHRRNDRHQRLKKFLHPKCNLCDKEFYTRLEWDDHKLTAGHLKKLQQVREEKRPHLGTCEFDVVDFIEDVNDGIITYNPDIKVDGERKTFTEEEKEAIENLGEELDETLKSKSGEDDKEDSKLPKYVPGTLFGVEFVDMQTGYLCRACYRFMPCEEDYKVHCQTLTHYANVVNVLKVKEKLSPKQAADDSKIETEDEPSITDGNENASEETSAVELIEEKQELVDLSQENEDEPSIKRRKIDEDTEKGGNINGSIDIETETIVCKEENAESEKVSETSKEKEVEIAVEPEAKPAAKTPTGTRGGATARGSPRGGSGRARRARRY